MSKLRGPVSAAVLTAGGAAVLLGSLFFSWSHQLTPVEQHSFRGAVLFGVAADPTAWQVYAIAGEVLAALAIGVLAAGLWGQRPARCLALVGVILAVAFVIHALSSAPTNGLLLATGTGTTAHYVTDPATPGAGEIVALVGLIVAGVGLAVGAIRQHRHG